jgi:hypothetical protein
MTSMSSSGNKNAISYSSLPFLLHFRKHSLGFIAKNVNVYNISFRFRFEAVRSTRHTHKSNEKSVKESLHNFPLSTSLFSCCSLRDYIDFLILSSFLLHIVIRDAVSFFLLLIPTITKHHGTTLYWPVTLPKGRPSKPLL